MLLWISLLLLWPITRICYSEDVCKFYLVWTGFFLFPSAITSCCSWIFTSEISRTIYFILWRSFSSNVWVFLLCEKCFHLLYHRIIECIWLEGSFKSHLVLPLCNERGHIPLNQVAQTLVQPNLKCFQGWGMDLLSGQPVPMSHHCHCKKTSSLYLI